MTAFSEGMQAYRDRDYPAAAETLAPVAERSDLPGRLARYYCAMSHRAIGLGFVEAGRLTEAAWHLRRTVSLIGNQADLAEYLRVIYARQGRREPCVGEAEYLAEAAPDDARAQVRLAQAQWHSGRRAPAIMTLDQALRRIGDRADLHLNLGLFHAAEADYDAAWRHLSRAVECDGTSVKAYRYLGLTACARGAFHDAVGAFQWACDLAPRDVLLTYYLCQSAAASAQAGRPVAVTLPASAAAPSESALDELAEYAAGEPDFVEAFLALPPAAGDAELFGVIAAVVRRALSRRGDTALLHYQASAVLARAGEPDAAADHAGRAVKIDPRFAKAWIQLADANALRGDTVEAAANLNRAVAAGADWPDVHARLAELLAEAGQPDRAERHYRRALQLNGRYRRAADGLRALAA